MMNLRLATCDLRLALEIRRHAIAFSNRQSATPLLREHATGVGVGNRQLIVPTFAPVVSR
jgi:hypothetical protein